MGAYERRMARKEGLDGHRAPTFQCDHRRDENALAGADGGRRGHPPLGAPRNDEPRLGVDGRVVAGAREAQELALPPGESLGPLGEGPDAPPELLRRPGPVELAVGSLRRARRRRESWVLEPGLDLPVGPTGE